MLGRAATRTAGPERDAPAQATRGTTKSQVPYLPSDPLRLAFRRTHLPQFEFVGFRQTPEGVCPTLPNGFGGDRLTSPSGREGA